MGREGEEGRGVDGVETRFGGGGYARCDAARRGERELIAVSREIRCRIFIRILFRLAETVSCTSGVMRWHLVRLVGVSPASFHTFNRCTMGYNDVEKEGRACSPTSETNKYCPSAALFRCPRNPANTSRTSYSLKWSGR